MKLYMHSCKSGGPFESCEIEAIQRPESSLLTLMGSDKDAFITMREIGEVFKHCDGTYYMYSTSESPAEFYDKAIKFLDEEIKRLDTIIEKYEEKRNKKLTIIDFIKCAKEVLISHWYGEENDTNDDITRD